jgi:hypothetical protein
MRDSEKKNTVNHIGSIIMSRKEKAVIEKKKVTGVGSPVLLFFSLFKRRQFHRNRQAFHLVHQIIVSFPSDAKEIRRKEEHPLPGPHEL